MNMIWFLYYEFNFINSTTNFRLNRTASGESSHNESEAYDLNSSKDSSDSEEEEGDKAAVGDVEKKLTKL